MTNTMIGLIRAGWLSIKDLDGVEPEVGTEETKEESEVGKDGNISVDTRVQR